MYIHYGTVDGDQMGKPRSIPVALYIVASGNGELAHLYNLYLSRHGFLSDPTHSVSSRDREIPESIANELK